MKKKAKKARKIGCRQNDRWIGEEREREVGRERGGESE